MKKQEIGKAIKESLGFIETVYGDTAKLMKVVDDKAKEGKLTGLWGSASMWNRSYAFYGSYGWLAHYLARPFVDLPPKGQKPSFKRGLFAFFNVYFVPELLDQPVVVYGAARAPKGELWPTWQNVFALNAGPPFLTAELHKEWQTATLSEHPELEDLHFAAQPLVSIDDQKKAEDIANAMVEVFSVLKKGRKDGAE